MCSSTTPKTKAASPAVTLPSKIEKQVVVPAPPSPPPGLFPPLQQIIPGPVPAAISAAFDTIKAKAKFKNLRFAIMDLSGPQPVYLGHHDKKQSFIASTAKLAALFAALWLRKTVRENAQGIAAIDGNEVLNKLKSKWLAEPKPYPTRFGTHTWPPNLTNIFIATPAGINKWNIDFRSDSDYSEPNRHTALTQLAPLHGKSLSTINSLGFRDRLELMIGWSDNNGAGSVINSLGFQFINGVLLSAGFYNKDPVNGGGLWLSGNYAGTSSGSDLQNVTKQGGTAQTLCHLMALAGTGKLVDMDVSDDFLLITKKFGIPPPDFNVSWIRNALRDDGHNLTGCHSKIGTAMGHVSEVALIKELAGAAENLKYVIACAQTLAGVSSLKELTVELGNAIVDANI